MRSMNRPGDPLAGRAVRPRRPRPTPLPQPRGPISRALLTLLTGPPTRDAGVLVNSHISELWSTGQDVPWWRADDDAALALVCLAELNRRGLEGVDDGWEGHPLLAAARWILSGPARRGLEELEEADEPLSRVNGCGIVRSVLAMVASSSTSHQIASGFREPFEDEVVLTAVQRLRERDAHATLLPTLAGPARHLLARTVAGVGSDGDVDDEREAAGVVLRGLGLPDRTGAHLDTLPGPALWRLAVLDHLVTHRQSRAVALGWLVAADALAAAGRFVTGDALRTRGFDPATARAWDVCVIGQMTTLEAAEHLVEAEPNLAPDVLLGARACVTAATAVDGAIEQVQQLRRRAPASAEISDPPDHLTDLIPTEGLS